MKLAVSTLIIALIVFIGPPSQTVSAEIEQPLRMKVVSNLTTEEERAFYAEVQLRLKKRSLDVDFRPRSMSETDVIVTVVVDWVEAFKTDPHDDLREVFNALERDVPSDAERHSITARKPDGRRILFIFYSDFHAGYPGYLCYAGNVASLLDGDEFSVSETCPEG